MVNNARYSIIWEVGALNNLKEILQYLSKQSVSAPKIVKAGVLNSIKTLERTPFIYEADKLRFPLNKNYRAIIVFSYRISYLVKPDSKEILILRLRHMSREPLGY